MKTTKELTLDRSHIYSKLVLCNRPVITRELQRQLTHIDEQLEIRKQTVQYDIRKAIVKCYWDVYDGTPKELAIRYTRSYIKHFYLEKDITVEQQEEFFDDLQEIWLTRKIRHKYNIE